MRWEFQKHNDPGNNNEYIFGLLLYRIFKDDPKFTKFDEECSLICSTVFSVGWFWSFDAFIQRSPKGEINTFGAKNSAE